MCWYTWSCSLYKLVLSSVIAIYLRIFDFLIYWKLQSFDGSKKSWYTRVGVECQFEGTSFLVTWSHIDMDGETILRSSLDYLRKGDVFSFEGYLSFFKPADQEFLQLGFTSIFLDANEGADNCVRIWCRSSHAMSSDSISGWRFCGLSTVYGVIRTQNIVDDSNVQ